MANKYDLLIFDWDGTLMDSADKIVLCFQAAARDCGVLTLTDQAIRKTIGLGVAEALARLLPEEDSRGRSAVAARYREHFLRLNETPMPLFPGVQAGLLDFQRRGYELAIATGKSRAGLEAALRISGLTDLFSVSRCADETQSKPDPLMLREILAETGVDGARAIMIGDTSYDIEMASRAGIASVAVSYGVHERPELLVHGPAACLDSFPELCAWFG
ncbi:MAG TPA: HAD-IA family hydrolase [Acidiferrobacter sp.]|nr:HAD-IA family hydrolase [Acidiferrobacter sp.]